MQIVTAVEVNSEAYFPKLREYCPSAEGTLAIFTQLSTGSFFMVHCGYSAVERPQPAAQCSSNHGNDIVSYVKYLLQSYPSAAFTTCDFNANDLLTI